MRRIKGAGIGALAIVIGVFAVLQWRPAAADTPLPQISARAAVLGGFVAPARTERYRRSLRQVADCPGSMLCCELGGGGTHACVESQGRCHEMGGALVDGGWCRSS